MCWIPLYAYNVNKTWALPQTNFSSCELAYVKINSFLSSLFLFVAWGFKRTPNRYDCLACGAILWRREFGSHYVCSWMYHFVRLSTWTRFLLVKILYADINQNHNNIFEEQYSRRFVYQSARLFVCSSGRREWFPGIFFFVLHVSLPLHQYYLP